MLFWARNPVHFRHRTGGPWSVIEQREEHECTSGCDPCLLLSSGKMSVQSLQQEYRVDQLWGMLHLWLLFWLDMEMQPLSCKSERSQRLTEDRYFLPCNTLVCQNLLGIHLDIFFLLLTEETCSFSLRWDVRESEHSWLQASNQVMAYIIPLVIPLTGREQAVPQTLLGVFWVFGIHDMLFG